jgi:hypothetical protein
LGRYQEESTLEERVRHLVKSLLSEAKTNSNVSMPGHNDHSDPMGNSVPMSQMSENMQGESQEVTTRPCSRLFVIKGNDDNQNNNGYYTMCVDG